MASYEAIINLRYANQGTGGTIEIKGATRARIAINHIKKTMRPGPAVVPAKVIVAAASPQVFIETESREEEAAAMVPPSTVHTLVLGYTDSAGNRKRTIKYAQLTGIRESQFPPLESGGTVPRFELIYDVVGNFQADADTLAEIFTDATDA